jgi:hypothetical protein
MSDTASAGLTVGDIVGISAIVLSVGSLAWQGVASYRGRRRIGVEGAAVYTTTLTSDGQRDRVLTIITIRNIGATTGIDKIGFDWEVRPEPGYGVESQGPSGGPRGVLHCGCNPENPPGR